MTDSDYIFWAWEYQIYDMLFSVCHIRRHKLPIYLLTSEGNFSQIFLFTNFSMCFSWHSWVHINTCNLNPFPWDSFQCFPFPLFVTSSSNSEKPSLLIQSFTSLLQRVQMKRRREWGWEKGYRVSVTSLGAKFSRNLHLSAFQKLQNS